MPRHNTVLKFFILIVVVLLGTSWAFLHSRSFGRLLSKAITEVSSKKFNAKVRFSNVSMQFFPPGVALENVRFLYDKDGTRIESQAGKLGVSFSYDLFRGKRTRISEIFLYEGWAKVAIPKSDKTDTHPWDQLQNELAKLPVQIESLVIQDSRAEVMGVELDVASLVADLSEQQISLEGEVKDVTVQGIPHRIDLASLRGTLERNRLKMDRLTVLQKRSQITAKGTVDQWANLSDMVVRSTFSTDIYLTDIKEIINLDPVEFYAGILSSQGTASWSKTMGPKASIDFKLTDFDSNVAHGKLSKGKIRTQGNKIIAEQFALENNEERLELLQAAPLWDPNTKRLFPAGLKLRAHKLDLQNVLSILKESLSPLRGYVTGDLDFSLPTLRNLHFKPHDGAKIEWLGLRTRRDDGSDFDIVRAPVVWLYGTTLRVDEGVFSMKGNVRAPQTQMDVNGRVGRGEVHFDVGPGPINLADFGNLAQLNLKGSGTNTIKVRGAIKQTTLLVEGDFKDFQILDYRLGDTRHQFIIDLGRNLVEIPVFNARKLRYQYGGTGIVQWSDFLMDLSIQLPQISFTEFRDAIYPLRNGLTFLPEDFEAMMQGNVELIAKKDIKNLIVAADVYAQKITAYGESFRDAKFAFLYKNELIKLSGFSMTKEAGRANGEISYSMPLSRVDYKISMKNLSSNEISYYKRLPFALDFKADGEFEGWRTPRTWRHRGVLGLSASRVLDRSIPNSKFDWDWRSDSVQFDGKFADDWIVLNALSLPASKGSRVDAKLTVNVPDFPLVLMGLLGENPQLLNAAGTMAMEATVGVTDWEWNKADIKTWIKNIDLQTPEIKLQANFQQPQVSIIGGRINRWDWRLDSPDLKLTSRAEGDFRKQLVLRNLFDVDAKYLEILTPHVQRAEGRVAAEVRATLKQNDLDLNISSAGYNLTVGTDLIPFTLSNLQYSVAYSDSELEIKNLSFRPNNGLMRANGTVNFVGVEPEMNVRWFLENATVPIKSRSELTLTGNGMIFGSRRPYVLSGDVVVNKGSVLNELSDFTADSGGAVDTKYLPKEYGGAAAGLLKLDLSARTENPVNLSNSLLDIYLAGDVQFHGDVFRPVAEGRVYVSGANSKAFFKNNEYQIAKADFIFNGRRPITKPDFDVVATSTITNYKVIAKAYGNPDTFTFDLNSEPALSKQNILSLIAFGYTDDLSNTITPGERQNLTNVGVGSFIFDQFKVTDIVKKQFGLQLNMGTVFEQSNSSMLSNRGGEQTGAGTLARTRTATNIEVKKRLSEAMSLSVSSTVGGQIGQRQRMNLNYGVTRGIQLEGIYELRTNADGQEDVIDNSIGGDVKFRMTFR